MYAHGRETILQGTEVTEPLCDNDERNSEHCIVKLEAWGSPEHHHDVGGVDRPIGMGNYLLHVWKGVNRCCVQSSFHGIPFFATSVRANVKVFSWIAVILVAIVFMFYSLSAVSTKYASGSIYTSTARQFPKQLPFPAVTICNANPFKVSAVFDKNLSLLQTDLFLTHIRTKSRTSLPESHFIPFVQWYDRMSGGNNTFYEDLGHKINDLVLSCTFDGRMCSVDSFTGRTTSSGLCYTFNPNGDFSHYYTNRHGYRYGLIVRINVEQYEYFLSEVTSAGLYLFIHDHDHFPYMGGYRNLLLSPGQSTLLSVTKTHYKRLSPPQGVCNDRVKLTLFKSYTRESCLIECETHLAIRTCGCRAEYMPGNNSNICTLNQTLHCILRHTKSFQFELCDCPIACSSTVYDTHLSYSRYPAAHLGQVFNNSYFIQSGVIPVPSFAISNYTDANGTVISYLNNNVTAAGLRANYLKLAVYYEAMEYDIVTEELQYTFGRFFADFTGFVGFFIGAGFLSFFEVIELIYSFIKPPR